MAVDPQELEAFRQEFLTWLDKNKPEDPDFLLPQSFMEVGTDDQFHFLRAWQKKVYEAGYLGMAWPKEYGGGGKPQAFQDIVTKELSKAKVPFMFNTIGLNWAGPLILDMGSEDQKKKYIPGILSGEDVWCQGFSEPDHGSDLGNAQFKAERIEGTDDYLLNGSKIWTSLGRHAKYMILLARTNPEANSKYAGLSYFLADMQTDGVEVVPIKKVTGEYGFNQTFFTDVKISGEKLMGEEGDGWAVAMKTLAFERSVTGGQAGGHSMVNMDVEDLIELARNVKRNGRPAIEDPVIRDELVKFVQQQRTLRLNAARARIAPLTQERPFSIPLSGKLIGSEFQREMCQFAISLQGSNAAFFVEEENAINGGLWQRSYFNAFSATIGGGTSQVQHNIIGERVLGLPK